MLITCFQRETDTIIKKLLKIGEGKFFSFFVDFGFAQGGPFLIFRPPTEEVGCGYVVACELALNVTTQGTRLTTMQAVQPVAGIIRVGLALRSGFFRFCNTVGVLRLRPQAGPEHEAVRLRRRILSPHGPCIMSMSIGLSVAGPHSTFRSDTAALKRFCST